MITTAIDDDKDRAGPLVGTLESLAARCDMRELLVRAHLHRWHLGDPMALTSARLLGADIDNPVLTQILPHHGPPGPTRRARTARPTRRTT
jgi:hypothetical protein